MGHKRPDCPKLKKSEEEGAFFAQGTDVAFIGLNTDWLEIDKREKINSPQICKNPMPKNQN